MKSATSGRVAISAIWRPARVYGETTRSAPAWASLASAPSLFARATMNSFGLRARARKRHVDVVGVGVDGRDETPGALDARGSERRIVRRVALDDQVAGGACRLERRRVDVDDDERLAGMAKLAADGRADPAVAADDEVAVQRRDRVTHPSRLLLAAADLGQDRLGDDPDRTEDEPDPGDGQQHRPAASQIAELVDLPVPHRREGDDGHIDRVRHAPAEKHDVSERADDRRRKDDQQPQPDVVSSQDRGQRQEAGSRGRLGASGHRSDATSPEGRPAVHRTSTCAGRPRPA